ncbi:hypothetical protein A7E75_00950 [Syntrophotalea acetylenica]|uniref:Uncharacterized protein n=1 Tax=Syntrophotalea acetylenica TaxID=29542 RepID=A0A1L3GDH1_SYNAC|nr:hypothetical protein A7E75_00950 [Syntrophotalea acetylenica]
MGCGNGRVRQGKNCLKKCFCLFGAADSGDALLGGGGKGISRRRGRLPIRQVGFSVMENCQQAESSLFRQC